MEYKRWHEYILWHTVDTAKINSKNYYELWVMFCYSFPLEVMSIHTCQCLSLQGSHFTITFAECLWGLRDCRKTLANVYPFLRSCTEIAFGVCISDQAFRCYTKNRKRKKNAIFGILLWIPHWTVRVCLQSCSAASLSVDFSCWLFRFLVYKRRGYWKENTYTISRSTLWYFCIV